MTLIDARESFPVKWQKTIGEDGRVRQEALIRVDDYWQIHVWVEARTQRNVEEILSLLLQLPTFTKKPKAPSLNGLDH